MRFSRRLEVMLSEFPKDCEGEDDERRHEKTMINCFSRRIQMFAQKIDLRAVICWLARWLAALGSAFSIGMLSWVLLFLLAALPVAAQSSSKLFGHTFLNGAETLVSIDPANGSVALVGTVPNSGSLFVQAGIAALDPAQHHYFFVDSNSVLHRMDTQTGVESAETSLSTSLFLAGMELEPGPSAIPVFVDIKPQSCPNPLNIGAAGVLPVAILGTPTFDVTTIDTSSVKLQGVSPLRSALEDVATPFSGVLVSATSCTTAGPDGLTDLVLSFSNSEVAAALGTVTDGQVLVLTLTGNLKPQFGGSPIKGQDVVVIKTQ